MWVIPSAIEGRSTRHGPVTDTHKESSHDAKITKSHFTFQPMMLHISLITLFVGALCAVVAWMLVHLICLAPICFTINVYL
jgi:hypothetical protein